MAGKGYIIHDFFTPSTALEYNYGNGILMMDYIKISVVDSLTGSRNYPNTMARIKADKMACLNWLRRLWDVGSTGTVPQGETFAQTVDATGKATTFDDHIIVQADLINNPQSNINLGERNIWIWYSYPAPTGSIEIGVGVLIP
jgi:hypothetical protein